MATIAMIDGAGALGRGLPGSLVTAGHDITIGSRLAKKTQVTAFHHGSAPDDVVAAEALASILINMNEADSADIRFISLTEASATS
ncbi:hypothetical protein V474_08105 [Novosphingobium barchaimii LL02]|uniref:Pyrroline-5-carboxylate reductase catalytic N-terminal domain-containing protein n=1 Tax=Novosphingobium barchaimii LL02 TaxID=1114963 RepID=A0A0J8B0W3_9SPHN|nr:NAD(P)-binding domain-containing protein [Novosphingobium barchaimii]KMS60015.1 hypothetical protein V474_08105 [Novosphingobium barchaimii LL02]